MATLKDIADYAGISISAASLAIRDHGKISIETKQRVWEAQEKLGYKINLLPRDSAARVRAGGESVRDIAFLLVDRTFDNPVYSTSFQEIADACFKKDWRPLYVTASLADLHKGKIPSLLRHQKVDGIIVSGVFDEPAYQALSTLGTPIVALGNYDLGEEPWAACETDMKHTTHLAVKRLKELGHTRLSLLNMGSKSTASEDSISFFTKEIERHGLINAGIALQSDHRARHPEASRDEIIVLTIQEMLSFKPTGVICGGYLAHVVYDACNHLGIRIPEDLSIIAIGSVVKSPLFQKSLARIVTIGGPNQAALRKLEQMIDDPTLIPTREIFPCRLLPGGSLAKAPTP